MCRIDCEELERRHHLEAQIQSESDDLGMRGALRAAINGGERSQKPAHRQEPPPPRTRWRSIAWGYFSGIRIRP